MTERRFAGWVQPIANDAEAARAQLIAYARDLPAGAWLTESSAAGWTRREVLAHVAGDTGKWCPQVFAAVLDDAPLDRARVGPAADVEAINARDVANRRQRSIEQLVDEIETDGELFLDMLACLTAADQNVVVAPFSESLGAFLRRNPAGDRAGHDREHLHHMRGGTNSPPAG